MMMTDDEIRLCLTIYEAQRHEWRRTMARHDVTLGWLWELHGRLSGPEFCGSGSDQIETLRLDALLEVEDRIERASPGFLANLTAHPLV